MSLRYARVKAIGLRVTVQVALTVEPDVFELAVQCWPGSAESFEALLHALEEAFA
jgi:hypothetical protein